MTNQNISRVKQIENMSLYAREQHDKQRQQFKKRRILLLKSYVTKLETDLKKGNLTAEKTKRHFFNIRDTIEKLEHLK